MFQDTPAWREHVRKRMRTNAHLAIRHDAYRFMPPGSPRYVGKDVVRYFWPDKANDPLQHLHDQKSEQDLAAERNRLLRMQSELAAIKVELKFRRLLRERKAYHPNQPRVPAGSREGGQWTSGEGTIRLAQNVPPGGRGPGRTGGRFPEAEPGQQVRLDIANARAQGAVQRVRELDPNWRHKPSAYGTGIESEIRKANDLADEAQARASELTRVGIGPGPFARESIPARGPGRDLRAEERDRLNRIGSEWGCHTCGTFDPGTERGNFVGDHQPPTGLNFSGRPQRLYPQCSSCSRIQGGWVRSLKGLR